MQYHVLCSFFQIKLQLETALSRGSRTSLTLKPFILSTRAIVYTFSWAFASVNSKIDLILLYKATHPFKNAFAYLTIFNYVRELMWLFVTYRLIRFLILKLLTNTFLKTLKQSITVDLLVIRTIINPRNESRLLKYSKALNFLPRSNVLLQRFINCGTAFSQSDTFEQSQVYHGLLYCTWPWVYYTWRAV